MKKILTYCLLVVASVMFVPQTMASEKSNQHVQFGICSGLLETVNPNKAHDMMRSYLGAYGKEAVAPFLYGKGFAHGELHALLTLGMEGKEAVAAVYSEYNCKAVFAALKS